ncbi:hypothetical protein CU098_000875, partial [Rhizopus stolonifer]
IVAVFELIAISPHIVWNALYSYPTAKSGAWGRFNLALALEMIWLILLIIFSALIAFKTRSVSSKWSETTQITYVSYNLGVSAIVMVPSLLMSAQEYKVALWLFIGSLLFGTTFTLLTLFVPKFICIFRHVFRNNKQLNVYNIDSEEHDQISIHSSNSMDQNIQLKLVAKNMYDFTTEAHEGILPVKKMARLDILSIWTLKRITLVPFKRYFILSSKTGQNADVYNYTLCEASSTGNQSHYTFRVRTDKGLWFLFQVYDNDSLNRWINWFNQDPYEHTNPPPEENDERPRPLAPVLASKIPRVNDLATFGNMSSSDTSHDNNHAIIPSNFQPYPTSSTLSRLSSPMNGLMSSFQSETSSTIPDDLWMNRSSGMNQQNSFGVIDDPTRQRYP